MAAYQKVYSEFWFDTKQWPDDPKMLALYLLTCEHSSSEGLFKLPLAYASEDLSWPASRVESALEWLTGRGWAEYEGQWVLVVKRLRHDQPKGGPSIKGAVKRVERAPRPGRLWSAFVGGAGLHADEFAKALTGTYGDCSEAPSKGHRVASQSPPEPTNTNTTTSTNTITSGGDAGALDPVLTALTSAGFNRLDVEADYSAIRQYLAERQPPADTDWDIVGQRIKRKVLDGTIEQGRPVSALKFVMNGRGQLPRVGQELFKATETPAQRRQREADEVLRGAVAGLQGQREGQS